MSRRQVWMLHLSASVVTLTGILYFCFENLSHSDDPFAVLNHPWQPFLLKVHILTAPLLLIAAGMILDSHVLFKLRPSHTRENRRSGLGLLILFPVMAISGYLLQVITDPVLLRITLWAHILTGIAFGAAYAAHQVFSFRALSHCRREAPSRLTLVRPRGYREAASD